MADQPPGPDVHEAASKFPERSGPEPAEAILVAVPIAPDLTVERRRFRDGSATIVGRGRSAMSHVSLIGLGAMGSALARAFLGAGHRLTVWNRSPQKMAPIVAAGASGADSLPAAIEASPIVVVCIDNYAATKSLLARDNAVSALSGRTLIQLSTGTPAEARAAEAWCAEFGIDYLDGAIMPYPSGIGGEAAQLLFAGPDDAYARCKPFLECLGGDLRYLGSNVAAAAVMDMALLTGDLSLYLGVVHGACLCQSEGVEIAAYSSLFADDHAAKGLIETIRTETFDRPGATIDVWLAAIEKIQAQARDAGISSELPDFIASFFKRATAMGFGNEDTAAIVKVMRSRCAH
jgi:3-hydroxyisobutyrate dehydrogenase-like beta-hydroxyacid dehydrogenase